MKVFAKPFLMGILLFALLISGCAREVSQADPVPDTGISCTDAWYQSIEEQVGTGDGQGHGPDIGSEEWKSVVESKLGVRGQADVPDRSSDNRCRYIDRLVSGEAQ